MTKAVWRQIYGISLWNLIVMLVLMLNGKKMLGLDYPLDCPTVRSAPLLSDDNPTQLELDAFKIDERGYKNSQDKVLHFTYIFNTFVFLQIFNEINCRKVGVFDKNVFESFFHNKFFLMVIAGTLAAQFFLTNYCSSIMSTKPLSRGEWGACLLVGSSVILVSVLLKQFIKIEWLDWIPTHKIIDETEKSKQQAMLRAYKGNYIDQNDDLGAESPVESNYMTPQRFANYKNEGFMS
jgi:magnesium-transporting ATPase (P-type)